MIYPLLLSAFVVAMITLIAWCADYSTSRGRLNREVYGPYRTPDTTGRAYDTQWLKHVHENEREVDYLRSTHVPMPEERRLEWENTETETREGG